MKNGYIITLIDKNHTIFLSKYRSILNYTGLNIKRVYNIMFQHVIRRCIQIRKSKL